MMKKLALCVAFVAGTAVLTAMISGCDDNGSMNNGGGGSDMAMGGGGGGGDMAVPAFQCVMTPASNDDFLNSCAPASVDKVEIAPEFPTLAPKGQLPQLQ